MARSELASADLAPPAASRLSTSRTTEERAATGSPAARGRYAVQVGAFRVQASAYSIRDKVAAQLARAPSFTGVEIAVRVVAGGNLFRVLVGEADDLTTASALAARIREVIQQDAFVTRAPN